MFEFPVSGVETWWWLPATFAFLVSALTSTAGLSGAFVLLPFQVSVLGYTAPGVTPTNLLFNVFAIPGGVYRFYREKRMVWPLVWTIAAGTVPGLLLGVIVRVRYLPQPGPFKLFVGLVLLYISIRLFRDVIRNRDIPADRNAGPTSFHVVPQAFTLRDIKYRFNGTDYRVSTPVIFGLSALVGMVGGIYGIGGGAILAPFLVTVFGLPIHTVSGAALCGTFLNSTVGVLFYLVLAPLFAPGAQNASPDWLLGAMFGIGGFLGIYLGARLQKFLPARLIKLLLALLMIFIAGKYIIAFLT